MTDKTLEALADALECFWNAALGNAQMSRDSTTVSVTSAMVEGFAAVANRLREHSSSEPEEAAARWVKTSERQPTVGGSHITGDWCETSPGLYHFRKDIYNYLIIHEGNKPTWYSSLAPKKHGPIDPPQYWLEGMPSVPTAPVPGESMRETPAHEFEPPKPRVDLSGAIALEENNFDIEVSITPHSSVVGTGLSFRRKNGPMLAIMTLLRAQPNDDYGAIADEILPRIVSLWNGTNDSV